MIFLLSLLISTAQANWYIVPCEHDSDEQCKVFAQGFVPKNVIAKVPTNLADESQEVLETYDFDVNECGEQPGIIDRGIKILSDAVDSITGQKEVEPEAPPCEPNIVKRVRVNIDKKSQREARIQQAKVKEAQDKLKRESDLSEALADCEKVMKKKSCEILMKREAAGG